MLIRTLATFVALIAPVAALPAYAQTDLAGPGYGRQAVSRALHAAFLDGQSFGMRPTSTDIGVERAFATPLAGNNALLAAPTFHPSNALSAQRRYAEAPAASAARTLDLDDLVTQSVATMLEETNPMLQQRGQRGRIRERAAQSGGSPERKWLGVGMMVVGGLWALTRLECVAAGGGGFCTPGLVIGGGLAGFGYYLFAANR